MYVYTQLYPAFGVQSTGVTNHAMGYFGDETNKRE